MMEVPTSIPSLLSVVLAAVAASDAPIVIRKDRTDAESQKLGKRFTMTGSFVPDGCCALIRPRWVLTAAHVARGLSPFSPRVRFGSETYAVKRVWVHPEAKRQRRRPPKVDLAVVELTTEVKGIKPVRLYEGSSEVGKQVYIAGSGDFGPAGGRLARGDGTIRAATNVVDAVRRGRLEVRFDEPPKGTKLEGVGGPGDSGGPLFLQSEGNLFLAGISSGSYGGRPGAYGTVDVYVRVRDHKSWIEETITKAATGEPAATLPTVDVRRGFPDDAPGGLAAAFFEAFNEGTEDRLKAFATRYRSESAARRSPARAFVRRLSQLRKRLGKLEVERMARRPGRLIVLSHGGKQWYAVHLRLDPNTRILDVGFRPDAAPADRK